MFVLRFGKQEAMKKAAAALLGSDSEEEEAARLEKERIEAEVGACSSRIFSPSLVLILIRTQARAPKVPVGPGVGISPLFTVPASPSVAFLSSVLHTTGLVLPQGAESGAGDAASQSGGSKVLASLSTAANRYECR